MKIEIYWNDLTEKKQKEIVELFVSDNNWNLFPMATLETEEEE